MLCLIWGIPLGGCELTGEIPGRAEGKIGDLSGDKFKPDRRRWAFTCDGNKLWNSVSQVLWIENVIAQIHETKVRQGLVQYKDTNFGFSTPSLRLHRLGRVSKERSLCTCSVFTLFRCLSLTIAGDRTLG